MKNNKFTYIIFAFLCVNTLVFIGTNSIKLTILVWLGFSLLWSLWSILLYALIKVDFKLINRDELERIQWRTIPLEISKFTDHFTLLYKISVRYMGPLIFFFVSVLALDSITTAPIYKSTINIFGKKTQAQIIESGEYDYSNDYGSTTKQYGNYKYEVNGEIHKSGEDGFFEEGEIITIKYLPFRPQNNKVVNNDDGFYKSYLAELMASVFIILFVSVICVLFIRELDYGYV